MSFQPTAASSQKAPPATAAAAAIALDAQSSRPVIFKVRGAPVNRSVRRSSSCDSRGSRAIKIL